MSKRAAEDSDERGFESSDDSICLAHLTDTALRDRLAACVEERKCSFCTRTVKEGDPAFAVSMDNLLTEVMEVARYYYVDASGRGIWDNEDQAFFGVSAVGTDDMVAYITDGKFDADVGDEVSEAIVRAIGSRHEWTADDSRGSTEARIFQWDQFSRYVKETSRFVFLVGKADNATPVTAFLPELLTYLDKGLGLITIVPTGHRFYRGRIVNRPDDFQHTATELGPAPPHLAAANRFSPPGISLLYASGDPDTAIAEISGHGPEPYAVIGRFETTRPLRILDFTRRPRSPSIFDRSRRKQGDMARFLESFIKEVTRAIVPDGRVHIEYAPTQVMTDYLRWMPETRIDGFALPSAQTGRKTFVLFMGADDVADEIREQNEEPESSPLSRNTFGLSTPTIILPRGSTQAFEIERTYRGKPLTRLGQATDVSDF